MQTQTYDQYAVYETEAQVDKTIVCVFEFPMWVLLQFTSVDEMDIAHSGGIKTTMRDVDWAIDVALLGAVLMFIFSPAIT